MPQQIIKPIQPKINPEKAAQIDILQDEGYSNYYIAKAVKVTENDIINYTIDKTGRKGPKYNAEIHTEHNYITKQRELIYKLYTEDGMTVESIAEMMGYSSLYVKSIIHKYAENKEDYNPVIFEHDITIFKLEDFKNKLNKGDAYRISICVPDSNYENNRKMIDVTVINKYPFIVETDKGSFRYFDLYVGKKIG